MKEGNPHIILQTTHLLISFVIMFLMFSCGHSKAVRITNTTGTTQIETVKKYVESAPSKVNTARDTIISACFQKDCSEGIKRFYIKGNLNGESYFRDNERFLVNKTYYENNGPLAHIDTLIGFKMVGASVIYWPNGQLQRITHRDKNGIEIGPYQSYYENGQQKLTVLYVNGKRNGEMVEYYQNGKVMQRGEFINDKRHGLWRMNDVHGDLKEEKRYDNGVEIR